MPHIAVARLWFEGNSFAPVPTPQSAFESREWTAGPEALARYAGTATELGAVAAFLAARPGWRATVLRCAAAQPGGPMADAAMAAWRAEVEAALQAGRFDGIYLSLHGACVTESDAEADLATLRRIRSLVGRNVPITASFDFHANMAPEAAELLDGASAYRTYPHVDMDRAAMRALALLERAIGGAPRAAGHIAKRPVVLHSFHMRDESGPMAEVWAEAAAAERPPVLDASLFGGFAWGDSPHAGPAAMVWAEDAGAARALAERLADSIAARRARFAVTLPGPAAALRQALAAPPGLVALLDPADNPLSGGIADTPGLLRALVEARLEVPAVFAFLHDPATVAAARAAGVGARITRPLGGRLTGMFGPPVVVEAEVERLTDGRFVNEGPMERGAPVDLGATCVLRLGPALRVICTARKEAAVDPAFFALHGIDLGATRLLANKAKNHFRAAFAGRCSAIVECDCPGPAALDLAALPFRHVPPAWRQA
ncbi:M81 family metallopeptidase [Caldovatus aquaticus]|uniref:Microcystinase C n=1 Tax=Caldovatus aquaticus TaxID=2865671 RepID=A0ABS7F3G1_9PROT|nr:M81 family metallopeptidase [Caldovatus aquaticus]MBW8270153.1 M81 family metallopeptidase [Caldovatus aquaticus]